MEYLNFYFLKFALYYVASRVNPLTSAYLQFCCFAISPFCFHNQPSNENFQPYPTKTLIKYLYYL